MSILLARRLYRHLLSIIEANGYDSINHRAATSKWDKLREFSTCAILTRLWKYDDGGRRRAVPRAIATLDAPRWSADAGSL
ncbi:MAG: hypothetical protein R3A46_11865 [Thermomicrobiales bacterium]